MSTNASIKFSSNRGYHIWHPAHCSTKRTLGQSSVHPVTIPVFSLTTSSSPAWVCAVCDELVFAHIHIRSTPRVGRGAASCMQIVPCSRQKTIRNIIRFYLLFKPTCQIHRSKCANAGALKVTLHHSKNHYGRKSIISQGRSWGFLCRALEAFEM